MLGLPLGFWIAIGVVALVAAAIRSLYNRFRGMCRGVRTELTQLLRERYSEVTEVREDRGDLVVHTADGEHRWEMADIYAAVARIPGMGGDPVARRAIYEQALQQLFPTAAASREQTVDPSLVRPQLVRPEAAAALPAGVVRRELPEFGLTAVYLRGPASAGRYVMQEELSDYGGEVAPLHQRALDGLRRDFPQGLVDTARESGSGAAIQLEDSHDAARLLLVPEHLEPGEELVALVPHRDLLLLLPGSQLLEPEKLQEGLRMLRCDGHPPLLERPVRVTARGFELI